MWRRIFGGSQHLYPPIRQLTGSDLIRPLINSLMGKIYYTPKIQKIKYSDHLLSYMAYLSRKSRLSHIDMRSFTENILTEYGAVYPKVQLKGQLQQKFGIRKNFRLEQDGVCPYHGLTDYLVFLSNQHFFPVMFFEKELNPASGAALAFNNMIMKSRMRRQPKTSGYSLLTNGQEWVMYKLYCNMHLERTIVYEGRNKLKNLHQDYEMVSVILGLIDCCLDLDRPDLDVLNQAYDLIDHQRFTLEASSEEQAKKNSLLSKVLVNYYQKKKDNNSK